MVIIIGGDLVPTEVNIKYFINGDLNRLMGSELSEIWFNADYRIFNLETPLSDHESPILKQGPNLIAPSETINGINKLKPTLVTLANNHILDHGEIGLKNTLRLLEKSKINYIGAGKNIYEAKKPYILKQDNKSVGIYACAEHEFSIAGIESPGANPFDPLESLDHIVELKNKCDYVIVIYHGGKEHYRYPSPYLQKVCRKMIDKGADIVICQHSHTIGAFEDYNQGIIVYGQGNFIFNRPKNEHWDNGLLIKIDFRETMKIEYFPFVRTATGIKKANKKENKKILDGFYNRSRDILEEGFVEKKYRRFAKENVYGYLRAVSQQGTWLSKIDRKILKNTLIKKTYTKKKLLAIRNYIECEAHRELFLKGIKEELKDERN